MEAAGAAPPDAFGPFRVLHQVGAGTLGPVFRAYDSERDRLVAVKVLRLDVPPERMHQLVAELERLIDAHLSHPAIAAPIATGTDGLVMYLVQDYVPAESLDVVMRDHGPLAPADALRVAAQLASALDLAADANVHHGVLHPRDVLILQDEARLTGLGVARAIETVGVDAPVRRPYTAPERIAGGAWDRRADIFSLAALLHEMLWGRRVTAIGNDAADALTALPGGDLAALRVAFARGLAAAPADRFETASDFAAAISGAFPDVSVTQSPVGGRPSTSDLPLPFDPPSPGSERRPSFGEVAPKRDGASGRAEADERLTTDDQRLTTGNWRLTTDEPRAAESARYEDVEVAPAIVAPNRDGASDRAEADWRLTTDDDRLATDARRLTTEKWPVAAALLVGVALGFAGGYGIGARRPAPAPVAAVAPSPVAAPAPGREFTEGTVNEPAKAASSTGVQADKPAAAPPVRLKPDATVDTANAVNTVPRGRLLVRSTPAGARVIVDGRDQGRTPASIGDLTRGSHRIRIERDGYVAEDRRVVVTAAKSIETMVVRLKPSATATAAPLSVDSRPDGAKVFIDGMLVGTTPMSIAQLASGPHAIRLERDGYRRWSSSVRIVAGERNRVTASLER